MLNCLSCIREVKMLKQHQLNIIKSLFMILFSLWLEPFLWNPFRKEYLGRIWTEPNCLINRIFTDDDVGKMRRKTDRIHAKISSTFL